MAALAAKNIVDLDFCEAQAKGKPQLKPIPSLINGQVVIR